MNEKNYGSYKPYSHDEKENNQRQPFRRSTLRNKKPEPKISYGNEYDTPQIITTNKTTSEPKPLPKQPTADIDEIKQLIKKLESETVKTPPPQPQNSSFRSKAFLELEKAQNESFRDDDIIDVKTSEKEVGSVVFERFSTKQAEQHQSPAKATEARNQSFKNMVKPQREKAEIETLFETKKEKPSRFASLQFGTIEQEKQTEKTEPKEQSIFELLEQLKQEKQQEDEQKKEQQQTEQKKVVFEVKKNTANPFAEYNRTIKRPMNVQKKPNIVPPQPKSEGFVFKENSVAAFANKEQPNSIIEETYKFKQTDETNEPKEQKELKEIIPFIKSMVDIKLADIKLPKLNFFSKQKDDEIYSSYSNEYGGHFGVEPPKKMPKKWLIIPIVAVVSLIAIVSVVNFFTQSTVYIIEDGQQLLTTKARVPDDVEGFLIKNDIVLIEQDIYTVEQTGSVVFININRAFPVTVSIVGEVKTLYTTAVTVRELLENNEITVPEGLELSKGLDQTVSEGDYIETMSVEYRETTETTDQPGEELMVDSPLIREGTTLQTRAEIVDGVVTRTYKEKIIDDEVVEREILYEDYNPHTVDAITLVGKSDAIVSTLDEDFLEGLQIENGVPLNYETVYAKSDCTAYSFDPGIYGASGMHLSPGFVAVDPEVIPYGTLLYITSSDNSFVYGYAIAADYCEAATEGIVDVDLFFETYDESVMFGRRELDIYVIKQLYQQDLTKFMSQEGMFEERIPE